MFGCGDGAGTGRTTLLAIQVYGRRSRAPGTEEKGGSEARKEGKWRLSSKAGGRAGARGHGLEASAVGNWKLSGNLGPDGKSRMRRERAPE